MKVRASALTHSSAAPRDTGASQPEHAGRGAWISTPQQAVLVLIAATALLRLLLGASLGLGIDESYTVATGRHPQLSYFDHPPLAWWLAWAGSHAFGSEAALAVRLPFIGLFALTTWLMFSLTRLLYGERAGFWSAATLNLAPVLAWTSGSWVLPDGPLNTALLAGAYCVAAAVFGKPSRAPMWWMAGGLAGGIALLSKLHGIFLFAGVGLFLITSPRHRRWLASPWPYAGSTLAIAVFLPVLVWNAQHHWLSFAFQAGRAQLHSVDLLGPIVALAGQAALLLPWLWLPLMIGLARALRSGPAKDRDWLLLCLAISPIAIFTAVSLTGSRTLPHWASPGYLMLFPLLGRTVADAVEARSRLVRTWLVASTASLAVILSAVAILPHVPWPQIVVAGQRLRNPIDEAVDWRDVAAELKARGLFRRDRLFVSATRWHEAGKIDRALGGEMPVLCLCRDPRGYGVVTRPADYLGQDALIMGRNLTTDRIRSVYGRCFDTFEQLAPITIRHAGQPAFELTIYMAHNLRPSTDQPSLLDALEIWPARVEPLMR